jgi:hypothetical protein
MKLFNYILITTLCYMSSSHEYYTLGINNLTDITVSIDSFSGPQNYSNGSYFDSSQNSVPKGIAPYISFKQGCYPGSESKRPNKIRIRVFPSMPLLSQFGRKRNLISHINQLFAETNKIFVNQINIRLIPSIVIPRVTDPRPINGNGEVLGDLSLFGAFLRDKPPALLNIFITNNYSGFVGAAYINVLGSKYFNYGVSKNTDSTLAHEILHMFGAQHTFGKGGVLDYSNRLINGVLQMHPDNRVQVCSSLDYYFKRT